MELPAETGIMVLPELVFFPHNLAPLHIFETRYRKMVEEALLSHRMFALHQKRSARGTAQPSRTGCLGLIRACVRSPDGTFNLILQGLCRVHFDGFTRTRPYFAGQPRLVPSAQDSPDSRPLVDDILSHLKKNHNPRLQISAELHDFLSQLDDYNALVDIVAGSLVRDSRHRQTLLESESTLERLQNLACYLRQEQNQD